MKSAAILLLLSVSPMSADTISIHVNGTVAQYFPTDFAMDVDNVFGGGSLLGKWFDVQWTFDTTCGSVCYYSHPNSVAGGFQSSISNQGPSPLISATLTINNHTYTFGHDNNSASAQGFDYDDPFSHIDSYFNTTGRIGVGWPQLAMNTYTFVNTNGIGGGYIIGKTEGFFDVNSMTVGTVGVPAPVLGTGLPGLILATLFWWRKQRKPARGRT